MKNTQKSFPAKRKTSFLLLSAPFLLLLFLLFSCENPDKYFFNVDYNYDTYTYDTATLKVELKTITQDSVRSDEFTKDLLGAYEDTIVGKFRASLFTNLHLPTNGCAFSTNSTLDSIVLYLQYSSANDYFGKLSDQMEIRFYELNKRIYRDSAYYSTSYIPYNSSNIGSWQGSFNPKDTSYLQIRLSDDFGNKLMSLGYNILKSESKFIDTIKGIAMVPAYTGNMGAVAYFLLEKSKVVVYYKDSAGKSGSNSFLIDSRSARISHFDHDYTGTPVQEQLTNPAVEYPRVFLQSQAGVKVKVTVPELKNLVKDSMIALHNATFYFTPDINSPYFGKKASNLLLFKSDSLNNNLELPDYSINAHYPYYGGKYLSDHNAYTFTITQHFQGLLIEYFKDPSYNKDYGLNLIIPSDNPISAVPLIIQQRNSSGTRVAYLKISYSKLK